MRIASVRDISSEICWFRWKDLEAESDDVIVESVCCCRCGRCCGGDLVGEEEDGKVIASPPRDKKLGSKLVHVSSSSLNLSLCYA
ncbi:hypothetical protein MTR_1g072660 [Medicago truncatula]|uniref:Uncharacterized protein n=1 Tax=Medicago truncatula TaxID=3880 RepID=G7I2K8_MEDTR|nr:hypothetical protein MTR_1g072660 [Medicago truncatula]